nr:helix-turn-helix domain-containing protein [Lentzea xinjiangensis]
MIAHSGVNEGHSDDSRRPRPAGESVTGRGHEDGVAQVPVTAQQELPEPPVAQLLYTPGQAAVILTVKESWLRKQAGQRRIPSTRLGKHLRFSHADLEAIVASAQRTTRTRTRPPRRHR